ncbi:MAG: CoA-binding protein [Bacteroidota bacterium]
MKNTLVIGASNKPQRYSNRAIHMLSEAGHPVQAYGLKGGEVAGVSIQTDQVEVKAEELDTVTLYVGPQNQDGLLEWLTELKPSRVIFNPGTENPSLAQALESQDIKTVEACTLVMLSTRQY